MPCYTEAAYGGESIRIENHAIRVDVYKRATGWGWVEVSRPDGPCLAVLEHFGEVKFPGVMIPARMEGDACQREEGAFGHRLTFDVVQTSLGKMLEGADFFRGGFIAEGKEPPPPVFEGTVTLTLSPDAPMLHLDYAIKACYRTSVSYIRGPWLKVGHGSFGADKRDGIFPGVEWLQGREWSSGTDWFQHPWALRVAPHPLKVTAPVMAVSHDGTGIGLSWSTDDVNRLGFAHHYPQPVYASPNFIDKRENHLMGLTFPSVAGGAENALEAAEPADLGAGTVVRFSADVFLSEGSSLEVLTDWIEYAGLPEPSPERYPLPEALDRIARAYNGHLWHEGKGWGMNAEDAAPHEPVFLDAYLRQCDDKLLADGLRKKLQWVRARSDESVIRAGHALRQSAHLDRDAQITLGEKLLGQQREDGAWPFDPEGVHKMTVIQHYAFAENTYGPIGIAGDTALDLCASPAASLLVLARATGEERFAQAARRGLDYCLGVERPEGGDWWETPLHSPNLLAAGHAAVAYWLAHEYFHEAVYRERAIHWLRAMLPFTHLWEPREYPMLYNTKPCFCSTNWWLANWVTYDVQWEVLQSFATAWDMGIDWSTIDTDMDWARFQKGVTVAAFRWMIDHEDTSLTIHNPEEAASGKVDTLFHDVFDTQSGRFGGALIMPDPIASNILAILAREP